MGEAEADGFVLTNTVSKTSMSSGLSPQGRRQIVNEAVPKLEELGACSDVNLNPHLFLLNSFYPPFIVSQSVVSFVGV